jgi:hypothetical protein
VTQPAIGCCGRIPAPSAKIGYIDRLDSSYRAKMSNSRLLNGLDTQCSAGWLAGRTRAEGEGKVKSGPKTDTTQPITVVFACPRCTTVYWRVRSADLLLGLQVQPFDRNQRRPMARSRPAFRSRAAVRLPGMRQEGRRYPAGLQLEQGAGRGDGLSMIFSLGTAPPLG